MIVVTHEMDFVREVSDRVVFMDTGQIIEIETPAEIFSAACAPRRQAFLSRNLK